MTQKERQARARQEIFRAAMEEFGTHNYDEVTMESICANHGISKGMMYHYYANKDDLFLLCVQDTFQALGEEVARGAGKLEGQPPGDAIRNFFMIREYYFQQHPKRRKVFENVMFRAPQHLENDIRELRRPIRELNRRFLDRIVEGMSLRDNLTPAVVMRYIECIDGIFPTLLRQYQAGGQTEDLHSMLAAAGQILDMVLFGLMQKEPPGSGGKRE